ncbi:hypothetical protein [Novispirillum itersonii]|uniref:Magnetosome membrane associated protein MmeA n=1 Tax=Novispirillum itersonii TaxID=189 RepID=A0A7X0DNY3_NOVIT|nr:hypothetical protein [Novispirillum itersonii]MBB6210692.1 hypothetical protein [Novispirillum itersonii]
MSLSKSRVLVLGVTMALAGCSFANDALFPSLGGEPGIQSSSLDQPPSLGSSSFVPQSVTPGQPTGTFVGQKVQTFRAELSNLQGVIRQRNQQLQSLRMQTINDSRVYHETVASVNARLQVGTTPGNPELHNQWSRAQSQLDRLNMDVAALNQLATTVSSDSAMTVYLLDSIRAAYSLSGAVDEDHRQLQTLEVETNQTVVLIERLLSELSQDISRQQGYIGNERSNLNTLALGVKNGQLYGASIGNQAMIRGNAVSQDTGLVSPQGMAGDRRPLVVIRFDRPNVSYEQQLYQAVSRAVERRPNAVFDLVAVSPSTGGAGQSAMAAANARRSAEQVMRSLTDMGVGADRIRMSAMSSGGASSNEVHLYVR